MTASRRTSRRPGKGFGGVFARPEALNTPEHPAKILIDIHKENGGVFENPCTPIPTEPQPPDCRDLVAPPRRLSMKPDAVRKRRNRTEAAKGKRLAVRLKLKTLERYIDDMVAKNPDFADLPHDDKRWDALIAIYLAEILET